MRKVLSFVLVLALVLGSFSMAFADFSDMAGEKSSEAVSVLKDLGVVAGYPDGTFRPDQIVTRAEMARFIVAALGLEQFAVGTTSKYSDMGQAPWAQGYVAYGTSLGFISGYPDGTFKPNQQVSFQEAASMLVRALGYTEAFLPGGWPAEWMIKANSLGIFDDVTMASGAAGADRGAIAQMLYNSLELEIGQVNNDNVWNAFVPSDTMLIRLGAEFVPAFVVTGAEDSDINLRPYVGKYVTAYSNDGDIITISEVKSSTLKGKFITFEGTDTTAGSIIMDGYVFEASDVKYTVNVAGTTDSALFFSNGDIATFNLDKTTTFTLEVKLSGKVIQDVYSVSKWTVSDHFMFSDSDADAIADDQELGISDFILDNNDDIDLHSFQLLGAASLSAIDEDNVVYVYANINDEIRKIEVGTATATGRVTVENAASDKFTIGGKSYDLSKTFDSKPVLGDTGTAYLDYSGKIYSWDKEDSATGNYAIVLDAEDSTTSLNSDRVKLLLADGTTKVFDTKDRAVTVGAFVEELVTYSVNSDGVITKINVQTVDDSTTLTVAGKLNTAGTIFDGAAVASNVIVFTYDGEDYDVAKLADVSRDDNLKAMANYWGTFTPAGKSRIEVMIIDADAVSGRASVYAVLNSVRNAYNDDDQFVQLVAGFEAGKAFSALTDDTGMFGAPAFVTPTLYKLDVNSDGVVTKLVETITTKGSLEAFVTGDIDSKDGTYLVQVDGVWMTIDSNAVVYQLDTVEEEYLLKSVSTLRVDDMVYLWQADKDSEVYDIVVFIRP